MLLHVYGLVFILVKKKKKLIFAYLHKNLSLQIPHFNFYMNFPLIKINLETIIFEPSHEKTNNLGFRPGQTQTSLYSHRSKLEA